MLILLRKIKIYMRFARILLLWVAVMISVKDISAQLTTSGGQTGWVKLMLQSDARKLLNHMSPMVEVDLPTHRGALNHNQLQGTLAGFFRQYPPKAITIDQQGALNHRNDFFIGTYTSGEQNYRLYIQAEKQDDGHKIFFLSIQPK
ncbi:MAG: DUF4783 domain-containing protein [Bacteroidetes bacterium]|nr:DUF4783 domain-containing protein [Bacteroidota bacterium]